MNNNTNTLNHELNSNINLKNLNPNVIRTPLGIKGAVKNTSVINQEDKHSLLKNNTNILLKTNTNYIDLANNSRNTEEITNNLFYNYNHRFSVDCEFKEEIQLNDCIDINHQGVSEINSFQNLKNIDDEFNYNNNNGFNNINDNIITEIELEYRESLDENDTSGSPHEEFINNTDVIKEPFEKLIFLTHWDVYYHSRNDGFVNEGMIYVGLDSDTIEEE